MKIELTLVEMRTASTVGITMHLEDLHNDKKSNTGETQKNAWQRKIEGSLAECAFAKFKNIYWNKGVFPNPDVGEFEVRSTPYENGYLRIKPNDPDDRKFYLLTGINGKYTIRGWMYAKDAKQGKYWKSIKTGRPPQYFVPQSDINHDL
jgi:hypothetical protein